MIAIIVVLVLGAALLLTIARLAGEKPVRQPKDAMLHGAPRLVKDEWTGI